MCLPIGIEKFEVIRDRNLIYVDKTSYISSIIKSGANVIQFTRPRRFGKTLFQSMLSSFFDISKDSTKYFKDLKIGKDQNAMDNYMNKFPVIFITLNGIEAPKYDLAMEKFKFLLMNLFESYAFLLNDDLSPNMREAFENLRNRKGTLTEMTESLALLSRLLFMHYKKKSILLIDECDVPLASAAKSNYYSQMLDVIRPLFASALKGNDYLEFAVLTGCLSLSKESLFTGLNNLKVYSLSDSMFSSLFGFTMEEVNDLLKQTGLEERSELLREWYDGYKIGKDKIFCPWDVVQYISVALEDPEAPPANYWAGTSGNDAIKTFIEKYPNQIKDDYSLLLDGKSIKKRLLTELTYGSLYSNAENIWTLFFHTGCLTLVDRFLPNEKTELIIPNEEIKRIFLNSVESWFSESLQNSDRSSLFSYLFSSDSTSLEKAIGGYLRSTISYYDYREDFYHGFLAGLFLADGYTVKSNRESGEGRADLIIFDDNSSKVALLEFKRSLKKEDMAKDAQKALDQIEEKGYQEEFDDLEVLKTA